MKKETFQYSSLKERIKTEYRVYIIAFIFILIADSIGQIKIPLGPGMLILFPIFYSLFMGILSGPQILKVMKEKEVTAASKLVIVAICPFIAKPFNGYSGRPGSLTAGNRQPGNDLPRSAICTSPRLKA